MADTTATVIYSRKEHVALITLNRPEADNVINLQLTQELESACTAINQDDDIHVAVITGAGDSAFCGGSEFERSIQSNKSTPSSQPPPFPITSGATAIAGIEKPVIAAINGDAFGEGLELALSCDIRIASDRARFGFPQLASGLIPTSGGTQRLPRLIGKGKALELILTTDIINAEEALEIGLVSQVVPCEKLASEVENIAQTMAAKAPIALRFIKEAVNKGLDLTLEQGLHLEADLYFLLHTTSDRTEGIKAFLEKRPPQFKGE